MQMKRAKRIAVIVRDRQAEALRMALGLTTRNDTVEVFIPGSVLDRNDPAVQLNLSLLRELGVRVVSDEPGNEVDLRTTGEIAQELGGFDSVIPY